MSDMATFSVTEAEGNLPELIDRALRGEGVVVTRHGRPVAEVRAIAPEPEQIAASDLSWLAARRIPARDDVETPSESLAALRDEDAG